MVAPKKHPQTDFGSFLMSQPHIHRSGGYNEIRKPRLRGHGMSQSNKISFFMSSIIIIQRVYPRNIIQRETIRRRPSLIKFFWTIRQIEFEFYPCCLCINWSFRHNISLSCPREFDQNLPEFRNASIRLCCINSGLDKFQKHYIRYVWKIICFKDFQRWKKDCRCWIRGILISDFVESVYEGGMFRIWIMGIMGCEVPITSFRRSAKNEMCNWGNKGRVF